MPFHQVCFHKVRNEMPTTTLLTSILEDLSEDMEVIPHEAHVTQSKLQMLHSTLSRNSLVRSLKVKVLLPW